MIDYCIHIKKNQHAFLRVVLFSVLRLEGLFTNNLIICVAIFFTDYVAEYEYYQPELNIDSAKFASVTGIV